jgi:6-phosphogluconate dehydrogenase
VSEGTSVWSYIESTRLHIPAPTLSSAHFLRTAPADRAQRDRVKPAYHSSFLPSKIEPRDAKAEENFIEDLRWAVYTAYLASYVQGMNIIAAADRQNHWTIDFSNMI